MFYECDPFFKCKPSPPSLVPVFESKWTEREGTAVLALTETTSRPNERLGGMMVFHRVRREQLPDAIREQMRAMYRALEYHVAEEAAQGCSIRPPTL